MEPRRDGPGKPFDEYLPTQADEPKIEANHQRWMQRNGLKSSVDETGGFHTYIEIEEARCQD